MPDILKPAPSRPARCGAPGQSSGPGVPVAASRGVTQPGAVLAAGAAPLLRPSDPPAPAAADGHPDASARPGRAGPHGGAGLPGASEPRGGAGPPDGAALLGAVEPLDVFGLRGVGGPPGEAGPPGGAGPLVGSVDPNADGGPAACRDPAAAARHATGLLHAAASPASEPPAFGLLPRHSED